MHGMCVRKDEAKLFLFANTIIYLENLMGSTPQKGTRTYN